MALPLLVDGPVLIRVLEWDKAKAWTTNVAHTRSMLVELLRGSSAISNLEAKRKIKLILANELREVRLESGAHCSAFTHALRSIGAVVQVVPAQHS